jgi:UDP-2,3-diacylglucosamine hydrolase
VAANTSLESFEAQHLIHGHTHHPDQHALENGRERLVLSDWDLGANLARADVLRLAYTSAQAHTVTVRRIAPTEACLIASTPAG